MMKAPVSENFWQLESGTMACGWLTLPLPHGRRMVGPARAQVVKSVAAPTRAATLDDLVKSILVGGVPRY